MRKFLWAVVRAALFSAILLPFCSRRKSNPWALFSLRLGAQCLTFHTTISRLNETRYSFRTAAFRVSKMIGKADEKKFELGDYFTGRA